jgi:hypothetical protein
MPTAADLDADFSGWEQDNAKFEREFDRLVKSLRTDEGREVPPKSRLERVLAATDMLMP